MTKETIYCLVRKYAKYDIEEITDDMDLFKDLRYDSLCFIEFVAKVEEMVGREFENMDELFEISSSVGNICEYILENL